jgi:hypothetical protein
MNQIRIVFLSLLASAMLFTTGCKDDDDANALELLSILANGSDLMTGAAVSKDLNAGAAATDVPLDAVITITFDRAVDGATVADNINLTEAGTDVDFDHTHNGAVVTITPDEDFAKGTVYTLSIGNGVKGEDGGSFTAVTRTFTTAGRADVTPPQEGNQVAYWNFDGNANSSDGANNGTEISMTYGVDRLGDQNSAAVFDGDASLIEVPNGDVLISESMSISYWIFVDSVGHFDASGTGHSGHFVMGVGDLYGFFIEVTGGVNGMKLTGRYKKADGTTTVNDFWFDANGQTGANGGWEAVEHEVDWSSSGGLAARLAQKWAHVVWVYDAATNKRHLYINGELVETDNLNIPAGLADVTGLTFDPAAGAPDVIGDALAIGYNHDRTTTHWDNEPWGDYDLPTSNHLKGMLDDLRIWNSALTASEVEDLYGAEKP